MANNDKQGKNSVTSARAKAANQPKRERESFRDYFKGVRQEMKKVVWPTRKELGTYTVVVLATCAICAVGFWLVDLGVLTILKNVLNITMN